MKTHLLNCLRCENITSMNDDRVLSDFGRIVLVQPVIVFREVTLLWDPELDGVVLHSEHQEPETAEESEDQGDDDDWDGLLTCHNTQPDINN